MKLPAVLGLSAPAAAAFCLVIWITVVGGAQGMKCERRNFLGIRESFHCPGVLDSSSAVFCCRSGDDGRCCESPFGTDDLEELGMSRNRSAALDLEQDQDPIRWLNDSLAERRAIAPSLAKLVGIIVGVILVIVVSCIVCCCCCPCCLLAKRRHRGTVLTQAQPAAAPLQAYHPPSNAPIQQPMYPTQAFSNPGYPNEAYPNQAYPAQAYPPSAFPPASYGYPGSNPPPYSPANPAGQPAMANDQYQTQPAFNPNFK